MTALLVAVYHNVGIPIAVARGASETLELPEQFHVACRQLFHIDLSH
jgi:hypothetical protein